VKLKRHAISNIKNLKTFEFIFFLGEVLIYLSCRNTSSISLV
jgi:hypothetical protein